MKTLAFFFALVSPALARLGETRKECAARYGPATDLSGGLPRCYYEKNGIKVEITFHNDVAHRIRYWVKVKPDQIFGERLSDSQVFELLNANTGGSKWKVVVSNKDGKILNREDEKAQAEWDYSSGDLELVTWEQKQREQNETAARDKAAKEAQRLAAEKKAAEQKAAVEGF